MSRGLELNFFLIEGFIKCLKIHEYNCIIKQQL